MIARWFTWATPEHRPSTVTGRPAAIRNEAELTARLAARKNLRPARSEASRKGHVTRRLEQMGAGR